MNRLYLLIFSLLFTVSVLGQSTFTPGWYIVEKGAFYSDYDPIALALGIDSAGSDDDEPFSLHIGEIVFVTEASGEIFYCFDPSGTPIILKGKNCLTKTPVGFGVGIISSEIQLLSGESLSSGMYVWIVGQDVAKQTIKIQIGNNEMLEIPESKIALLTPLIKKNSKASWFREAE